MILNKAPFENEYVKYWIKDGVLHTEFAENLDVDIILARNLVQLRLFYIGEVSYPSIADISNLKRVSFRAMIFWASEEAYLGTHRVAIFSKNRLGKVLFNFWSIIDRPVKPTRYFNDMGAAYLYLKDISAN